MRNLNFIHTFNYCTFLNLLKYFFLLLPVLFISTIVTKRYNLMKEPIKKYHCFAYLLYPHGILLNLFSFLFQYGLYLFSFLDSDHLYFQLLKNNMHHLEVWNNSLPKRKWMNLWIYNDLLLFRLFCLNIIHKIYSDFVVFLLR